jgi:coenzyme F420-reducing hydrogenase gamma subunit
MKPKIGVFSFTSCEGCQLTILNLEDEILALLGHLDIVNFREAIDEKRDDYDVAFVEGSISRTCEEEEVKEIRRHAKFLVAIGACACLGGINAIKNRHDPEETRRTVYGEGAEYFDTLPIRRVRDVVTVDYEMHGCPIDKKEFIRVAAALLMGQVPKVPTDAVCNECKAKANVCLFDKGEFCLGVITREGCGAICPTYGEGCAGCRGFVDHPNIDSMVEVLRSRGMSRRDIALRLTEFNALTEVDLARYFPN